MDDAIVVVEAVIHHIEHGLEPRAATIKAIEEVTQNPGPVPRGRDLVAQDLTPTVPAGLPSDLLQRRPDIRSAEQSLVAANFSVEAARAAYFPRISLTGFLGGDSTALSSLFTGAGSVWGLRRK